MTEDRWTVGIDVGGTFTDLHAVHAASGRSVRHKVPSTPSDPAEAILSGLHGLCGAAGIAPGAITRLSHGSTVATNALIQHRGGRVALITTRGFRDLLEIGRQTRPRIYDFQADHPPALVPRERRFEAAERVTRGGRVLQPLERAEVDRLVALVAAAEVDACAICFLFAFARPDHERMVADALRAALPALDLSLSSEVQPEFREYERLSTTVLNATLQPVMGDYLARFEQGAASLAPVARLGISQSSGGLISVRRARRFPIRTALSGPAAGVAGAVQAARASCPDAGQGIVTLDIGGTSSDIALIRGFTPGTVFERWIEGYPARMPSVDIHAIGAGGGSIAWLDRDGLLKVGPHSAGARPGPACYGSGGTEATVTDANLLLGRLSPTGLLDGAMPMRTDLAAAAVDGLATRIGLDRSATALGIVDVAVATMVRGIRAVSIERGHDPRGCVLLAFGGAGPLHAAAVARSLGITRVLVPTHPGLLCAEGLLAAGQLEHFVLSQRVPVDGAIAAALAPALEALRGQAAQWFGSEGVADADRTTRLSLDMRYVGQNFELGVPAEAGAMDAATLQRAFFHAHDQAYGFHNADAPIEVVGVRLAAASRTEVTAAAAAPETARRPAPEATRPVWFDRSGPRDAAVHRRGALRPGDRIAGPAIVEQFDSTTLLFEGDEAHVDGHGALVIELRP